MARFQQYFPVVLLCVSSIIIIIIITTTTTTTIIISDAQSGETNLYETFMFTCIQKIKFFLNFFFFFFFFLRCCKDFPILGTSGMLAHPDQNYRINLLQGLMFTWMQKAASSLTSFSRYYNRKLVILGNLGMPGPHTPKMIASI